MSLDYKQSITIAFYITNHGYGHASRNVAVIQRFLEIAEKVRVLVKSDAERCDFIHRNLGDDDRVEYFPDCSDVGLVLKDGTLIPDISKMKKKINEDVGKWPMYIEREREFLKSHDTNVVIIDVICWAIYAAKCEGIKTLLIGNFTWASMYKSFYEESVYQPYLDFYRMADRALWYEIHEKELEMYVKDFGCISLVSRKVNYDNVETIKGRYKQPIVFVSLGASADISREIDVSSIPYDFVTTRGIELVGLNVYKLPDDMINTMDYIAAADYIIAKGGWSTVSEILLQSKPCALLMRGNNTEDNITKEYLESRRQCVAISEEDLIDIEGIIKRIKLLKPMPYEYYNSVEIICDEIIMMARC